MSFVRYWTSRPVLLAVVAGHSLLSLLVWLSGGALGTYGLECQIGVIGYDATHGLNPAVPLFDYFDTFTGGYLTMGLTAAPFTVLPWDVSTAIKAGNLLTNAVILVLAWLFLDRHVGRTAARVGLVALALGPPIMRHHSLIGPGYHYNELLFDFGMAVLWAEIVLAGRKSWRWYLALGLVCGYGITNCYGTAAFAAVTFLALWIGDRGPGSMKGRALVIGGGLLGLAPLVSKMIVNSYHQGGRPLRDLAFSHTGEDEPRSLVAMGRKLVDFVAGDYGGALGYIDTLDGVLGVGLALRFGQVYGLVTLLAMVLVLALYGGSFVGWIKAIVPMRRFDPSAEEVQGISRVLFALFVLAFIPAYLTAEMLIRPPDPALSQLREDRFLAPICALLAVNFGVLVQLLWDRWFQRAAALLRWGGAACLLLLAAGCLVAQTAMIDGAGLADPGLSYRGRCYSPQALYAADVLDQDVDRARLFCSGFPEEGWGDCFRGFAWTVGIDEVMGADEDYIELAELPSSVGESCQALPLEWQRDCFRQLGWHLQSEGVARIDELESRVDQVERWCQSMPDEERRGWCLEGLGFYYADHYAFAPAKLTNVFPTRLFPESDLQYVASGIGYYFSYAWEERGRMETMCAAYDVVRPGLGAACLLGVEDGLTVYDRPMPGGAVSPGRLPSLPAD